jgi:hypothetical protein
LLQRTHVQHVQQGLVSDASRLLGLEGLAVQRVASDAFGGRVVHVVTADKTAPACPKLWGALCHPEGSGLYQAKGHPLRDNKIASDLAQTAVALQGTAVPPGLLHRVATRRPGTFEADDTVSGRAGVSGCRAAAMRVRGRGALRRQLAHRPCRFRRARPGPAGGRHYLRPCSAQGLETLAPSATHRTVRDMTSTWSGYWSE